MKTRMKKKYFLGFLSLLLTWSFSLTLAIGDEYPTKPIDFIINFGAGGTTDVSSRALIELASKYLGQSLIPINKIGAAGAIGVTFVKNAKPDGYTIGVMTNSPPFVLPFVQDIPYDVLKDFTFIMNYGEHLFFLADRSDKPWKTWGEVIDFARSHPGELKVGVAGSRVTNVNGIALSRIMLKENIKFTFIPFKSSAEILTATLGGHIDIFASSVDPAVKDYIGTGKLRVLAFLSDRKLPGFENIPNTREIHGVGIPYALGIIGPKGLPSNIVKKLEEAFLKSMKDPSFEKLMANMDTAIIPMTSQQFTEYIHKTYIEQKKIIGKLKEEEAKK